METMCLDMKKTCVYNEKARLQVKFSNSKA